MKINRRESQTISEQAAQWLCTLDEGGPAEQKALMEWLSKSPRHVEEFLFATATWQTLRAEGAKKRMAIGDIVAEVAAQASSNVFAIDEARALPSPNLQTRRKRLRRTLAAGVAGLAVTAAVAGWILSNRSNYATAIGEQRTVRLEDGSVLYLNTASRARVNFTEQGRDIELLEGEALFVVAQERARPFRVTAGNVVVRAVGTQFNVHRQAHSTRVSVIEGRVQVSNGETVGNGGNLLDAGEQASVAGDGRVIRQAAPDIARSIAWRERRLVFHAERLEDVIAEINRYSPRHFRVEGEHAREVRLTATFDADSPQSLAEFLRKYSDLTVQAQGDDFVVRSR